jgi:hypothetical protein
MAIKLPSHLYRTKFGTLHFRIAVPADLRHHFRFNCYYSSLYTCDIKVAAAFAQEYASAIWRLYKELRTTMDDSEDHTTPSPNGHQRLADIVKAAKRNNSLWMRNEQLENQLSDAQRQNAQDRKRHERELGLALHGTTTTPSVAPASPILSEVVSDLTRAKVAKKFGPKRRWKSI